MTESEADQSVDVSDQFTPEELKIALAKLREMPDLEKRTVFIPAYTVKPSWHLVDRRCAQDFGSNNPALRRQALLDAREATLQYSNNYESRDYVNPSGPRGIRRTSIKLPNTGRRMDFFIAVPVKAVPVKHVKLT